MDGNNYPNSKIKQGQSSLWQLLPHLSVLIPDYNSDKDFHFMLKQQCSIIHSLGPGGRLAVDNTQRIFHLIRQAQTIDGPSAILSLDAEKAFDQAEWPDLQMS